MSNEESVDMAPFSQVSEVQRFEILVAFGFQK